MDLVVTIEKLVSSATPAGDPVAAGLKVFIKLHAIADGDGPDANRMEGIIAGMYRLSLRESVPAPEPEVMAGMLGRTDSEALCRIWPMVRATAALKVVFSNFEAPTHLGTEVLQILDEEAEKLFFETGALALLQGATGVALGTAGMNLWKAIAARPLAEAQKHGVEFNDLIASLLERPPHVERYKPVAEVANVIAYHNKIASSRLADERLVQLGQGNPRTLRRIAKAGVPLSDPEAVEAERQHRQRNQRHQVEDRLTMRQVARGFEIPESTLRLALKRARAAGRQVGSPTGTNITYAAADIPIIREYLRKPERRSGLDLTSSIVRPAQPSPYSPRTEATCGFTKENHGE